MKILIIVLLSLFSMQEKPVQPESKKTETPAEKKEVKSDEPAVLAVEAKSKAISSWEIPAEIKIKNGDGEIRTFTGEEIRKLIESSQSSNSSGGIVFENGAFYTKIGNVRIPLPGGGASGCLGNATVKTIELSKDSELKIKDEKENSEKPKQQ